jgi:hypothetical protein
MTARLARLWERVDELIDAAATPGDLYSHRLELLAARRFRATGRPVPVPFVEAERFAAVAALTAPVVVQLVADTLDEPSMVIKGPEVAAHYPDAALRSFWDVDILVRDAQAAQQRLLDAGFTPVGDPALFVDIHHLRPLQPNGMALAVEIHSEPKWLEGKRPPALEALFEAAMPGALGVEGVLTLRPAEHALVLAAHSWAHEPLRRLRELLDVALVAARADPSEIDAKAREWKIERMWRTTMETIDSIFFGAAEPRVLRVWAQNLRLARERTVLEHHAERLLSDFWARPLPIALRRLPLNVWNDARPERSEGARARLARARLAVRNASQRRSEHHREWASRMPATRAAQQRQPDDDDAAKPPN